MAHCQPDFVFNFEQRTRTENTSNRALPSRSPIDSVLGKVLEPRRIGYVRVAAASEPWFNIVSQDGFRKLQKQHNLRWCRTESRTRKRKKKPYNTIQPWLGPESNRRSLLEIALRIRRENERRCAPCATEPFPTISRPT